MARKQYPSDKQDQFMLRFPDGMRDRIKAAAQASGRSMNAEIVQALEDAYPAPVGRAAFFAMFKDMVAMIQRLLNEHPKATEKRALEFALVRNYFDAAEEYVDDLKRGNVAGLSRSEADKILKLWEKNSEGIEAARSASRLLAQKMLDDLERAEGDS